MAVIQFEWGQFDQWVDNACAYIANESNPAKLRGQVCDAFIRSIAALADTWAHTGNQYKDFAMVVQSESFSEGFEKMLKDKYAKLIAVPQWGQLIKDTLHTVASFQIEVLTNQGVFEEVASNDIPYLDFWFDSFSGLYKYSTSLPEEHSSNFS